MASDARDSAIVDPELGRLIDAWPELPEHARRALVAILDSVG